MLYKGTNVKVVYIFVYSELEVISLQAEVSGTLLIENM